MTAMHLMTYQVIYDYQRPPLKTVHKIMNGNTFKQPRDSTSEGHTKIARVKVKFLGMLI